VDLADENAAKKTNEDNSIKPMVAAEKDTKDKGRESVGRNQPRALRFEVCEHPAVTQHDEQLRYSQLEKNRSKDEKDARVTNESVWLINPKLCHCGGEKEERENKVTSRLRLLSAENENREPNNKGDEDAELHPGCLLEVTQHFIGGAPTPRLARG